jgi:hypothetical protein
LPQTSHALTDLLLEFYPQKGNPAMSQPALWLKLWRAIFSPEIAITPTRFDPFPDLNRDVERCRNVPPLTQKQATLLLYFLGTERKLDPIRIMKGIFIFTMEAPDAWLTPDSRYNFKPYSWGPYSKEVDSDLSRLTLYGYLNQTQAIGKSWNYYSLSALGKEKAAEAAAALPPAAVAYLSKIREFLLGLTFRKLLDTVYARWPEYAVNSVFKS